nr:hypothetical protein [Hypnocyclicus thermotrophus]
MPSKFEIGNDNIRLNGVELILDDNKNVKEFNRIDVSLEELDFI